MLLNLKVNLVFTFVCESLLGVTTAYVKKKKIHIKMFGIQILNSTTNYKTLEM